MNANVNADGYLNANGFLNVNGFLNAIGYFNANSKDKIGGYHAGELTSVELSRLVKMWNRWSK